MYNNLKVSVDSNEINEVSNVIDVSTITFEDDKEEYPYTCYCDLNTQCECGCRNLTEVDILDIYHSLDILSYPDAWQSGYRLDTLHLFGTQELSTDDIISYFLEYSPSTVEWINDESCNVVFKKESSAIRSLINMTEECEPFDSDDVDHVLNVKGSADSEESFQLTNYVDNPPPGKWRKAFSIPEAAKYLYLRYAHKSDIKEKGAERKSRYYQKHGNPNFGGKVGIISNSYRKRIRSKRNSPDSDVRHVKKESRSNLHRQMVVYDGLYSDSNHSDDSDDDYPQDKKTPRLTSNLLKSKQTLTTMRMVADLEDLNKRIPASNRIGSSVHNRLNFDARRNIPSRSDNIYKSYSSIKDRLGPSVTHDGNLGKDLRKRLTAKKESHRRHRNFSDDSL